MERTELSFAGETSDLRVLRAQLTAIFLAQGWAPERQTDMLLAADELATNAITHAATGFAVTCTVDHAVTIEVEDGNPQELPRLQARRSRRAGGFGLRIVDHVAREWTVEVRDHTKLVRAVFDRPNPGGSP